MIWIVLAIACWASWEFVIRRRPSYDHEKFTARKVGSVVWFFPWSTATVGFIPIFRSLISVYDCKKQDDGSFTWDRDPTVDISNGHYGLFKCYEGGHWGFVVMAMLALMWVVPFAMRMIAVQADLYQVPQGTWFRLASLGSLEVQPKYLGWFLRVRQSAIDDTVNLLSKVTLSLFSVMFTSRYKLLSIVYLCTSTMALILSGVIYPPYKRPGMNHAMAAIKGLGVWTCSLGVVTVFINDPGVIVTAILLWIGWGTVFVAIIYSARSIIGLACLWLAKHVLCRGCYLRRPVRWLFCNYCGALSDNGKQKGAVTRSTTPRTSEQEPQHMNVSAKESKDSTPERHPTLDKAPLGQAETRTAETVQITDDEVHMMAWDAKSGTPGHARNSFAVLQEGKRATKRQARGQSNDASSTHAVGPAPLGARKSMSGLLVQEGADGEFVEAADTEKLMTEVKRAKAEQRTKRESTASRARFRSRTNRVASVTEGQTLEEDLTPSGTGSAMKQAARGKRKKRQVKFHALEFAPHSSFTRQLRGRLLLDEWGEGLGKLIRSGASAELVQRAVGLDPSTFNVPHRLRTADQPPGDRQIVGGVPLKPGPYDHLKLSSFDEAFCDAYFVVYANKVTPQEMTELSVAEARQRMQLPHNDGSSQNADENTGVALTRLSEAFAAAQQYCVAALSVTKDGVICGFVLLPNGTAHQVKAAVQAAVQAPVDGSKQNAEAANQLPVTDEHVSAVSRLIWRKLDMTSPTLDLPYMVAFIAASANATARVHDRSLGLSCIQQTALVVPPRIVDTVLRGTWQTLHKKTKKRARPPPAKTLPVVQQTKDAGIVLCYVEAGAVGPRARMTKPNELARRAIIRSLPPSIWSRIVEFVDMKSAIRMRCTCRALYRLIMVRTRRKIASALNGNLHTSIHKFPSEAPQELLQIPLTGLHAGVELKAVHVEAELQDDAYLPPYSEAYWFRFVDHPKRMMQRQLRLRLATVDLDPVAESAAIPGTGNFGEVIRHTLERKHVAEKQISVEEKIDQQLFDAVSSQSTSLIDAGISPTVVLQVMLSAEAGVLTVGVTACRVRVVLIDGRDMAKMSLDPGALEVREAKLPKPVRPVSSAADEAQQKLSPERLEPAAAVSPPGATKENADGVMATLSYDWCHSGTFRYYCGRRVQPGEYRDACGSCSGRCGPNHGCQCVACSLLLVEGAEKSAERPRELRQEVNQDGVLVHKSVDTAHGGRELYYCGREVGQAGYHQPCGDCDGRCGPNNGCQCKSCALVGAVLNSAHTPTHLSFDGLHTMKEMRYCGREVGQAGYHQPCGDCDGRCGPTHGCQCEECAALQADENASVKNCAGAKATLQFDSYHEQRSRYYCGRRVGQGGYYNPCDGLCDGYCGDTGGCQCKACHALERSEGRLNGIDIPTFVALDEHTGEYLHYCGRFVGEVNYETKPNGSPDHPNGRGECEKDVGDSLGLCGPVVGRQCKACYGLDHEGYVFDASTFKNAGGRTVRLHPPTRLHMRSLHRCDSPQCAPCSTGPIEGQDQPPPPGDGDDEGARPSGSQCQDCYALDNPGLISRKETTNFQGRTAKQSMDTDHTHGLRYYCGARVGRTGYMVPCGSCDGWCGPDSRDRPHSVNSVSTTATRMSLQRTTPIEKRQRAHSMADDDDEGVEEGGGTGYSDDESAHPKSFCQCRTCQILERRRRANSPNPRPNNFCQCRACWMLERPWLAPTDAQARWMKGSGPASGVDDLLKPLPVVEGCVSGLLDSVMSKLGYLAADHVTDMHRLKPEAFKGHVSLALGYISIEDQPVLCDELSISFAKERFGAWSGLQLYGAGSDKEGMFHMVGGFDTTTKRVTFNRAYADKQSGMVYNGWIGSGVAGDVLPEGVMGGIWYRKSQPAQQGVWVSVKHVRKPRRLDWPYVRKTSNWLNQSTVARAVSLPVIGRHFAVLLGAMEDQAVKNLSVRQNGIRQPLRGGTMQVHWSCINTDLETSAAGPTRLTFHDAAYDGSGPGAPGTVCRLSGHGTDILGEFEVRGAYREVLGGDAGYAFVECFKAYTDHVYTLSFNGRVRYGTSVDQGDDIAAPGLMYGWWGYKQGDEASAAGAWAMLLVHPG